MKRPVLTYRLRKLFAEFIREDPVARVAIARVARSVVKDIAQDAVEEILVNYHMEPGESWTSAPSSAD